MKKLLITLLSILVVIILSVSFIGCGNQNNNDPNISEIEQEKEQAELVLGASVKEIIVGDTFTLSYYTNVTEQVSFNSSNTGVASVDAGGVITANTVGQTLITVTAGSLSKTCSVSVVTGGNVPVFGFNEGLKSGDVVKVYKNSKLNLSTYTMFNGKVFYDAIVNYQLSDDFFGTVDSEGIFTAKEQVGEVVLTVNSSWHGITGGVEQAQITIQIITNNQVFIDEGKISSIKLYTLENFGGNNYPIYLNLTDKITAESDYNANLLTTKNYKTEVVDANGVVNFNSNIISAVKYGNAKLKVTMDVNANGSYTDAVDYEKLFDIEVIRPTTKYAQNIKLFSQKDGDINGLNTVFGKAVTLVDAYQGGDEYTGTPLNLSGNKITDLKLSNLKDVSVETVTVYDDLCGYVLSMECYTKVIKNKQDFISLLSSGEEKKAIDGYYILTTDITGLETDLSLAYIGEAKDTSYFNGTLDGNGHSVTFSVKNQGGLFGFIGDATIKNLSLTRIGDTAQLACSNVFLADRSYGNSGVTIDNCFIKYQQTTFDATVEAGSHRSGLSLIYWNDNQVNVKNTVIDMSLVTVINDDSENVGHHGAIFANHASAGSAWANGNIEGLYVISNCKHIGSKKYSEGNSVIVASGDANELTKTNSNGVLPRISLACAGAFRFESYVGLKSYFDNNKSALNMFAQNGWDTTLGFPIKGNVKDYVEAGVQTLVDGQDSSQITFNLSGGSCTLDMVCFGDSVDFNFAISNNGLLTYNKTTKTLTFAGTNEIISAQSITLTSNIQGVSITRTLSIIIDLGVQNCKTIYYTPTDSLIPTGLGNITKITDKTNGKIYYENGSFVSGNFTQGLGVEIPVYVFVDGLPKYQTNIISATKFINNKQEFESNLLPSGSTKKAINGYYVLTSDITDLVTNHTLQYIGEEKQTSYFNGTLDGNGHKVVFTSNAQGGLFGFIGDVTLKNISIIRQGTVADLTCSNVLLADRSYGTNMLTLENCYIKYQQVTYDVNVAAASGGSGLALLFWNSTPATIKDTVIDMSLVTILNDDSADMTHHGVIWAQGVNQSIFNASVIENLHVVGKEHHLGNKAHSDGNSTAIIKGDNAYMSPVKENGETKWAVAYLVVATAYRYDDYAAIPEQYGSINGLVSSVTGLEI